MKNKLNTVRGIACMCVVYFHVIGDGSTGLKLDENNMYTLISDFLVYIRMPLFTFLSGFVYAYRRFDGGAFNYLIGKSRRVLLPFVFVSTIFALIQFNTPGTNKTFDQDLWSFFLYPYAHFWFLQSIFTIFIIIAFLDYFSNKDNNALWGALIVSVPLFFYSDIASDFFAFSRTLYLLPFFLFGMIANLYKVQQFNSKISIILIIVLIVLLGIHATNLYSDNPINRLSLLALLIGCIGSFALIRYGFENKFLIYIGGFSYSIYLFHVFGTASSRMFLNKLGVESISFNVLFGLFVGIVLPIVIHLTLAKFKLGRVLFLGIKSKNI